MRMSMNPASAERELALPRRKPDTRSPFVRLTELIADITPGKPVIDLGVGEPQARRAGICGAGDSGAYQRIWSLPQERGHAAIPSCSRRVGSAPVQTRPCSGPDREVLVLSGSREGLFLGSIRGEAARDKSRRPTRDSHSQSLLRGLFGRRCGG